MATQNTKQTDAGAVVCAKIDDNFLTTTWEPVLGAYPHKSTTEILKIAIFYLALTSCADLFFEEGGKRVIATDFLWGKPQDKLSIYQLQSMFVQRLKKPKKTTISVRLNSRQFKKVWQPIVYTYPDQSVSDLVRKAVLLLRLTQIKKVFLEVGGKKVLVADFMQGVFNPEE